MGGSADVASADNDELDRFSMSASYEQGSMSMSASYEQGSMSMMSNGPFSTDSSNREVSSYSAAQGARRRRRRLYRYRTRVMRSVSASRE
mmetsp:Transcript_11316/g.23146  ORF Transcript_11316/g.23146 Transcript_11316/m.23146 type:complete len:90 (+) Transcript_11316:4031-4300(+)